MLISQNYVIQGVAGSLLRILYKSDNLSSDQVQFYILLATFDLVLISCSSQVLYPLIRGGPEAYLALLETQARVRQGMHFHPPLT